MLESGNEELYGKLFLPSVPYVRWLEFLYSLNFLRCNQCDVHNDPPDYYDFDEPGDDYYYYYHGKVRVNEKFLNIVSF